MKWKLCKHYFYSFWVLLLLPLLIINNVSAIDYSKFNVYKSYSGTTGWTGALSYGQDFQAEYLRKFEAWNNYTGTTTSGKSVVIYQKYNLVAKNCVDNYRPRVINESNLRVIQAVIGGSMATISSSSATIQTTDWIYYQSGTSCVMRTFTFRVNVSGKNNYTGNNPQYYITIGTEDSANIFAYEADNITWYFEYDANNQSTITFADNIDNALLENIGKRQEETTTAIEENTEQEKKTTEEIEKQNEKDDQDRNNIENQENNGKKQSEDAQEELNNATNNNTTSLSNFVKELATITDGTNCTLAPMEYNGFKIENINLCQLSPPNWIQVALSFIISLIEFRLLLMLIKQSVNLMISLTGRN